jgi:hypothetical protein
METVKLGRYRHYKGKEYTVRAAPLGNLPPGMENGSVADKRHRKEDARGSP